MADSSIFFSDAVRNADLLILLDETRFRVSAVLFQTLSMIDVSEVSAHSENSFYSRWIIVRIYASICGSEFCWWNLATSCPEAVIENAIGDEVMENNQKVQESLLDAARVMADAIARLAEKRRVPKEAS